jgi:hypothetical protein
VSDAAAAHKVAVLAKADAKASLNTAIAMHDAAVTRESNAAARSSIALRRRHVAWDCFMGLLSAARGDAASSSSSSVVSVSPTPGRDGKARAFTPVEEDAGSESDGEVFEGFGDGLESIGEEGVGEGGLGAMDIS